MMHIRPTRLSQPLRIGVLAMLAVVACSDTTSAPGVSAEPDGPEPALEGLIVSNPTPGAVTTEAALSLGRTATEEVAYVSLRPGSVPEGQQVVITTRSTGTQVTAPMVAGGFDPVPVAAGAGDTLDVRIELITDAAPLEFAVVVPIGFPPIIVRTDPPPKRQDVPLNATLLIVFSEPIDAGTLTDAAVRLSLDGVAVAGTLAFGDEAHLTVTFTPAAPLVAGAEYTLRVTEAIADPSGDALANPVSVMFTTQADDGPGGLDALIVSNPVAGNAYVSLPPGSVLDFGPVVFVIANRRTGAEVRPFVVDGGLDPFPIAAAAGDTLDVRLDTDGGDTALAAAVVPAQRAPVVVRTDPPPGAAAPRDATPLVVFSEPIDSVTLTDAAVQLSLDGVPVAGTLAFGDEAHLTVTFAPVAPLAASTAYQLSVTPAIADLDGDTLAASTTVDFVTRSEPLYSTFFRITPWTFEGYAPRYLLGDDSTFTLEFPEVFGWGRVEYQGSYSATASEITFYFADGESPDWRASGVVTGDSLIIAYNSAMQAALPAGGYAKFEDGVYLRLGSPVPKPPALVGRIAFVSAASDSNVPYIHVATADGSNIASLTIGRNPAWSPDGQEIAFQRWSNDGGGPRGIYVMDADGSNETWLATGGSPAWSPDGTRIVFSDTIGLAIMNADGTGVTTLLNYAETWGDDPDGMGGATDPAWSPDGERIAFTRRGSPYMMRGDQLHVINADGSGLRALARLDGCARGFPAWSPDGAEIAFLACGHVALAAADGSGSAYRFLTVGARPVWSPDGRWVALSAFDTNEGGIYLIDTNGGVRRLLIANPTARSIGGTGFAWTAIE